MPLIELSQATIPFPGRLKENGYDGKEVLMKLKKLQVNSTESATSLRRFLKEKLRIREEIKAIMHVHCSTTFKDALPPKEKDQRSFTLPCSIDNMCFNKDLVDFGASTLYARGYQDSIDPWKTILSTAHAKIDVFKRKFALRIRDDKIVFYSNNPTSNTFNKVYVLGFRERIKLDLDARLMGEAMILNRSQDPKLKDFIELNDLNEPLELNDHEVEDLDPVIEEG
uniref:Reverse transcriptase domain-containing protein n=1 Tax=Tanacetum cinerariifolium TaxID=118510 RepID=A0A6L2LLV3_TANCI|nr:hypothetical protein [Tanacetum cinerariifolium]